MAFKRLIVDRGHGLSNSSPGAFDPGAIGKTDSEASLASLLAGALQFSLWRRIPVIITPELSRGGVVDFVNRIYEPGDFFLVLHLNSSSSPSASGVECIYASSSPAVRARQALYLADRFSSYAGLVSRGAKSDLETPKGEKAGLPILRNTRPPALLLEAGFVSNEEDVRIIREVGGAALAGVMSEFMRKESF